MTAPPLLSDTLSAHLPYCLATTLTLSLRFLLVFITYAKNKLSMPVVDKNFIEEQMHNPTGAVGRCGRLRKTSEMKLDPLGMTSTYANDDIGAHRVENRSEAPAMTLHVYAPGLRKMTLFRESGDVCVHTVGAVSYTSEAGRKTGLWNRHTSPDGVIDVEEWNKIVQG